MPIEIRSATEIDIPVVLELIRDLAQYEKMAHLVTATEDQLRETLFGARPAAEVLLAAYDGKTSGFAVFFSTYSTFLAKPGIYLEDIFVKTEFRGKGMGLALMRRIARLAVDRGCGKINWQVLRWNEPSIRFYEGLGAEVMDDWVSYRLRDGALEELAANSR